jgi:hypothetical protein
MLCRERTALGHPSFAHSQKPLEELKNPFFKWEPLGCGIRLAD